MGSLSLAVPTDLLAAAARCSEKAARSGQARTLLARWSTVPAPALPPACADDAGFRLEEPARGFAIDAEGRAAEVCARGPERFAELMRGVVRVGATLDVVDAASADGEPVPAWVGGFAFDADADGRGDWAGFPAARLVLPERMTVVARGRAWVHHATRVEPGEDAGLVLARLLGPRPPRRRPAPRPAQNAELDAESDAGHLERLALALRAVRSAELEKLVVARSRTCHAASDFDPAAVLQGLRTRDPECWVFAVTEDGRSFVGASPERLLRVAGGTVAAEALAGSAPRSRDPQEDEALARALRESKKEQEEHAVVVRALHAALTPVCDALRIAEAPGVRKLAAIQHLHTPALGRLRPGLRYPLLSLAARLHPSPAVSGAPRDEACAWLRRHEGLERGWYAGAVGWMDLEGQGELAVALRSALLSGSKARLFAGAGIVGDSDPAAELRETRLKLGAMLGALGEQRR